MSNNGSECEVCGHGAHHPGKCMGRVTKDPMGERCDCPANCYAPVRPTQGDTSPQAAPAETQGREP